MANLAQQERAGLAAALAEVGPDAPTLCTGWSSRDLAAHVVARERRPDSAPGLVIGPLGGWTERVRRRIRDEHTYAELVRLVRGGPPWWSPLGPVVDGTANAVELFIHHEDVRRGRPGWQPRDLPGEAAAVLWARLRFATWLLRRYRIGMTLHAPGHGERHTGRGAPQVVVTGPPGELLLFCSGRQQDALVEVTGPDDAVAAVRSARFGF